MADVTVYATNSDAGMKYGLRGPVFTSSSVCYVFFTDGNNFYYKKSTDGGATFGSAVTIADDSGAWVVSPATWFDKWTPGDTGTKIHIAYSREVGGDSQVYRSLDTASDTLSSEVTISSLAYADISQVTTGFSITKARGGNLYVAMFGGDIADSFYRSTDGGANWTSRNAGYWESDNDDTPYCILMPGNESDNQDIYMVFGDQSADEVSVKHYDDSANTWPTELSIATSVTLGWVGYFIQQVAVSIRHSDNHLIIAAATNVDNAAADLIVYDVTDISTKTAKTNIITNQDDWSGPTVLIDQNTDDIYVAWLGKGDGTGTFGSSIDIYYSVSTDGGSTWGTATKYNTTAGDYRWIAAGVSTPGAAAGRFAPTFWSNATDDLFINNGNSVSISAGGSGMTGTIAATITKATAALAGTKSYTGTAAATLQKLTAALSGYMQPSGAVAATLQAATGSAAGTQTQTGTIAATLSKATAAAAGTQAQTGTAAATLSMATASASGVMQPTGAAAATLTKATAALAGTHTGTSPEGTAAATLQAVTAALAGTQTQTGAAATSLQPATAALTGTQQFIGQVAATLQVATAALAGTHSQTGSLAATLQILTVALLGSQTQTGTIAATLQAATAALAETVAAATPTPIPMAGSYSPSIAMTGSLLAANTGSYSHPAMTGSVGD